MLLSNRASREYHEEPLQPSEEVRWRRGREQELVRRRVRIGCSGDMATNAAGVWWRGADNSPTAAAQACSQTHVRR